MYVMIIVVVRYFAKRWLSMHVLRQLFVKRIICVVYNCTVIFDIVLFWLCFQIIYSKYFLDQFYIIRINTVKWSIADVFRAVEFSCFKKKSDFVHFVFVLMFTMQSTPTLILWLRAFNFYLWTLENEKNVRLVWWNKLFIQYLLWVRFSWLFLWPSCSISFKVWDMSSLAIVCVRAWVGLQMRDCRAECVTLGRSVVMPIICTRWGDVTSDRPQAILGCTRLADLDYLFNHCGLVSFSLEQYMLLGHLNERYELTRQTQPDQSVQATSNQLLDQYEHLRSAMCQWILTPFFHALSADLS